MFAPMHAELSRRLQYAALGDDAILPNVHTGSCLFADAGFRMLVHVPGKGFINHSGSVLARLQRGSAGCPSNQIGCLF